MKLKVKTQDDRLFVLDVTPYTQIRALKADVQNRASSLEAASYRVLYQGRFLDDDSILHEAGVEDGHTVLLVPRPPSRSHQRGSPSSRARPSNRRREVPVIDVSNLSARSSHRRLPPEVLRFLQAQQTVFAMIQAQRGGRSNGATDEELDAMENQPIFEAAVNARECDTSDLLLGFAFGFLLGPVAGLCLIENAISRHLRAGMLMGIICEALWLFLKWQHISQRVYDPVF